MLYAVSYLKLSVAGKINFISYDKYVYLESVVVKNYVETTDGGKTYDRKSKTLEDYSGRYLKNSESTTVIDISTLNVLAGESLVIEITMKSLSEDEIIIQCENNQVGGVTVTYSETTLPSNPGGTPESGESGTFVITISNATTGVVDMSSLSMNIQFKKAYDMSLLKTAYKQDGTTVDYYYVELGTTRWKYVADASGMSYTSTEKPTTLEGYYMATGSARTSGAYLAGSKYDSSTGFHTDNSAYSNIYGCDYATSDIRATLKSSTYLTSIGVDIENDKVYKLISPRTVADLYTSLNISASNTNYGLSIAGMAEQTDCFWLPSYDEIENMICGGTWNTKADLGSSYYLRSRDCGGNMVEWILCSDMNPDESVLGSQQCVDPANGVFYFIPFFKIG